MAEIYITDFRIKPDFRRMMLDIGMMPTERESIYERGLCTVYLTPDIDEPDSVTLKFPDVQQHKNGYPLIGSEASEIGRTVLRGTNGHYVRFFKDRTYQQEEEMIVLLDDQGAGNA